MKLQSFLMPVLRICIILLPCLTSTIQAQPRIIWLLPKEGGEGSAAHDVAITQDGPIAVGRASNQYGMYRAVYWTPATGEPVDLGIGLEDTDYNEVTDISDNGRFLVGNGGNDRTPYVFWMDRETGQIRFLEIPSGYEQPSVSAVSEDGSVVVGLVWSSSNVVPQPYYPIRWKLGEGAQVLELLYENQVGEALDVSADGKVVVGTMGVDGGQWSAFRWREGIGIEDLNVVYASLLASATSQPSVLVRASAITPDGRFIAGEGEFEQREKGYYILDTWTPAITWIVSEETIGEVHDITPDGKLIVGSAFDLNAPGGSGAFRWSQARGLELLNVTFSGVLLPNQKMGVANGISADGRYIVGEGYNDGWLHGFILDTGISTAIEEKVQTQATAFRLLSLHPNPFRETAYIRFQVTNSGHVRLVVYDLLGRSVRTLLEGLPAPGEHEVIWNGRSDAGVQLPAGPYLLRLEAGRQVQSRTITLLR